MMVCTAVHEGAGRLCVFLACLHASAVSSYTYDPEQLLRPRRALLLLLGGTKRAV
jgi:hypothetical protein